MRAMPDQTTANMLADVPLFALLDESERKVLADRCDLKKFKKDDLLFKVGDPGDSMYVLTKGEVELFIKTKTGEPFTLEKPKEGDFFGEISLLDEGPRSATAKALTDVEAIEIDQGDLAELFKIKPTAAFDLLAATGKRLRETSSLLRNAATRDVNEEIEDTRSSVMKVADWIAEFSGSLPFLFIHIGLFALWIGFNVLLPVSMQFDPFPFGFLTLVVSLEAIILSVFVLLSQNRQIQREKVRSDIEYDVNLKAEMQIQHMHEKVDNLYSEFAKRLDRMEKRLGGAASVPPLPPT